MASERDHIALANKNHDAIEHLLPDAERFPEWIATIAFYKAVQVIEAVFSNHPTSRNSTNHLERLNKLQTTSDFHQLYPHARALYSASTIARYLYDNHEKQPYTQFTDFMPASRVVRTLVYRRLRPIEEHSVSLLSTEAKHGLKRFSSEEKRT